MSSEDNTTELSEIEEGAGLKSVTSGGESATWDTNSRKAKKRHLQNTDQLSQAKGKVRPTFGRAKMRGPYS